MPGYACAWAAIAPKSSRGRRPTVADQLPVGDEAGHGALEPAVQLLAERVHPRQARVSGRRTAGLDDRRGELLGLGVPGPHPRAPREHRDAVHVGAAGLEVEQVHLAEARSTAAGPSAAPPP